MANPIEIEIKVTIENLDPLLETLKTSGTFVKDKHQIDTYYRPAHRDFLEQRPVKEWLRLRNSDGNYSINYKNWHYRDDGVTDHCDELETAIADYATVEKLLTVLNFELLTTVDKNRSVWNYGEYEVAIDTVKDLGDFVEVEYKGTNPYPDPQAITAQMMEWLSGLGCGSITRDYRGYPYMLLFGSE